MDDNSLGGISMDDIMAAAMSGLDDQPAPAPAPAPVPAPAPAPASAPTPISRNSNASQSAIKLRDFHCNNCGAPLKIPTNSKGIVVCPDCRTECVIEGLVKNAEIADKENINSGIPLVAEPALLHKYILNAFENEAYIPLDIYDKVNVIAEDGLCVPAYLYYCNGTVSFTYEAGNTREHKNAIDLGDRVRVEKEQYTEWTQMNGMASDAKTVFAPGNKELAPIVLELFSEYTPSDLIDVEDLNFPYDVETYNYNLPQSAAFNEYVRPYMEQVLAAKAEESLRGKTYKNLSTSGGCNIQKDEIIRVFLGIYRVVYEYNGAQYCLYVTGDGRCCTYDPVPVDMDRKNSAELLQSDINNLNKKKNLYLVLAIVLAITIIGAIYFGRKYKETKELVINKQQNFADFSGQADSVRNQFLQERGKLYGIYEDL